MTFSSRDPQSDSLEPLPLWRSIGKFIMAWIEGRAVSGDNVAQWTYDLPTGRTTCDLIAPGLVDARDVYVVDSENGSLFEQVDNLVVWAASVKRVTDIDSVMAMVLPEAPEDVLVIVNIDTMQDIDSAVESLIAFRLVCPYVPVVIGSATFSKNNFTQQRRPITDASVRLPCSSAALALAIGSSVVNSRRH